MIAFKGGQKNGKKGGLIRGLLCVQFVIAITLLLCTGIVFKQLNYLQNKDLGLEKENVISIYTGLWYNVDGFKQEILKNPNVIRLLPPLCLTMAEADEFIGRFRKVLV